MRAYSSAALTALASNAIVKRRMILFEMAAGDYGFWDDAFDITPVNGAGGAVVDAPASGKVFKPGGSLFEISQGSFSSDGAAPELTLRLRSVPNSELTPDLLATFLNEPYKNRRASVFRALFSATTGALIEVGLRSRGYLDVVTFNMQPNSEGQGQAYLEARVETSLIEFQRRGAHDRNHESQSLTFASDDGLRNIDRIGKVRKWAKGVKPKS